MRVLVLGSAGMMGHMVVRLLSPRHEVFGSTRERYRVGSPLAQFLSQRTCLTRVDALRIETVVSALAEVRPAAVINCIGIVKQRADALETGLITECNALFPHRLSELCRLARARLIHLSTDCVFSGRDGNYKETSAPDPIDLYGRTKLLGEIDDGHALTIRTSIVGRQLTGDNSLFEWAIANRGRAIRGYDRAVYSGLTTMTLAKIIDALLTDHADLAGIWHVASSPISKYELLVRLNDLLGLGIHVERDEDIVCDRSLDGSAFEARTGLVVPGWDDMLHEFRDDQPTYRPWR